MKLNRRTFLTSLLTAASGFTLSPTKAMATLGTYSVIYTITGDSDESIETYLKMVDSSGVREHNKKLQSKGQILNKTVFKRVDNCRWESTLTFHSKEAFEKFLSSSRPIMSETYEFKKKNNITVGLRHLS